MKSGQKLAECGNSGYSTDPHLHFQIQSSSTFAKVDKNYNKIDIAMGKKVKFNEIALKNVSDVKKCINYSPIKNDIVSNYENK